MTEKLSECCGARTQIHSMCYDWPEDKKIIRCSKCGEPCTIASKPDASPDRLLTDEEITKCYKRTKFPTPGAVEKQICLAQDAKTYPLALETGKKLGMTPEQVKAHGDICYEAGKLEGKKEQVEKDRQEIERLQTRLETIINDLPEEVWHEFIEEVGSFYRHCKYCDYSSNPEEHNSSICSKRLQQSIADAKKQGMRDLAKIYQAENPDSYRVYKEWWQAKLKELGL